MKPQGQAAKRLLSKYGIKSVRPMQLVQTAQQLNKSLIETLKIIAFLNSGSQGYGPFPYTTKALTGQY